MSLTTFVFLWMIDQYWKIAEDSTYQIAEVI